MQISVLYAETAPPNTHAHTHHACSHQLYQVTALDNKHYSLVRGSSWGFRPSWAQKPVVGAVRGAEEFPAAGRMSSESAVCKLLTAMPNPS